MMSSTEVTIISGQSGGVEEVYSVRKQALELGKQLITPPTEDTRRQHKDKMGEPEPEKRMEGEAEKREEEDGKDTQKGREAGQSDEELGPSEGTLIDIKV
jgi:hypothetical protein